MCGLQAAVWLRLGECLNSTGDLHGAVAAYTQVVEKAPSHFGGRVSLSALQQQLGKHEEAIQVLSRGVYTRYYFKYLNLFRISWIIIRIVLTIFRWQGLILDITVHQVCTAWPATHFYLYLYSTLLYSEICLFEYASYNIYITITGQYNKNELQFWINRIIIPVGAFNIWQR